MQFAFQHQGRGVGAVSMKMTVTVRFPAIEQVDVAVCPGTEQCRPIVDGVVEFVAARVVLPAQRVIVVKVHAVLFYIPM